jgi:P-type Cu2+ transporter
MENHKHTMQHSMDHSKMDHGQMSHSSNPGHGHMGHDHHRMMIEDFRKRFWITLVLTVSILFLSPMIQGFFGYEYIFPGSNYVLFALSTVVYFYGGWPFIKGFWDEVREGAPGMMTLIAMAISVAYFYSTATVFGLPGMDFFWELATLIAIMLLGTGSK